MGLKSNPIRRETTFVQIPIVSYTFEDFELGQASAAQINMRLYIHYKGVNNAVL